MQAQSDRVSGLRDHTGYWLDRLRGLVHGSFEQALAGHDVTVAQWCVLIALLQGDARTPREVAEVIGVDPGAVTRLLDRLEAKALLRRVPAPTDRRSVTLELTAAGRAVTPALAGLADSNDRAFFGALTAAEQRQFRFLLGKLLASRGVVADPGWLHDGPPAG